MSTPNPNLDAFCESLRKVNLGPRTIEEYRGILTRALAAKTPLDYIQSIEAPGSRLMPLAACTRWAKFSGNAKLAAAIAEYKEELRHRIPPRPERQPFSAAEMDRLRAHINTAGRCPVERFALRVLLRTGARSSDICSGITREVLQTAQRNGGVAQIRTKGQRLRKVNFTFVDAEVKALLATPKWTNLYDLLAPSTDTRECSNKRGYRVLDLRFKALCAECKVSKPWITHRCRHTIAYAVYSKTKDLMAVRNWFGWASTGTAERYSHGAKFEEVDAAVDDVLPDVGGNGKGKKPKGKR